MICDVCDDGRSACRCSANKSSVGASAPIEQRRLTAEATAPTYRALTEEKLRQEVEGGDLVAGGLEGRRGYTQPTPSSQTRSARDGSALVAIRSSWTLQDGWARPLGTSPTHTAPYDPRRTFVRTTKPHHRAKHDLLLAKIELARLGGERKAQRIAKAIRGKGKS